MRFFSKHLFYMFVCLFIVGFILYIPFAVGIGNMNIGAWEEKSRIMYGLLLGIFYCIFVPLYGCFLGEIEKHLNILSKRYDKERIIKNKIHDEFGKF